MKVEIVRAEGAGGERKVDLAEYRVPDLWHVAQRAKATLGEEDGELILDVWHLAHDLRKHILKQNGRDEHGQPLKGGS